MKAIQQDQFGSPDVLKVVEIPDPAPLDTEVLVRTRAVGLNPVEVFIRDGRFPLLGQPPFILGWDIAGVVPGTHRFREGDEVFGMPLFPRAANGYAEKVAHRARSGRGRRSHRQENRPIRQCRCHWPRPVAG